MQKNTFREGRTHTVLHKAAADFLNENANTEPFITISYVHLNQNGTIAKVYCSVFPNEQQDKALAFLKRKEFLCREYIQKHTSLRVTPTVHFLPAKEISW